MYNVPYIPSIPTIFPSITATIINDDPTATDSLSRADFDKFLHRTSFPWARETLRHHASEQYLFHLLEASPNDVLHAIPGMLLQHMSLPLVSMSRSNIKNRLDNKSFDIALKSKLRIPIYNESSRPLCFCGTRIDCHADHYFSCGECKKTRCSNKFRDTTKFVMKRILQHNTAIQPTMLKENSPTVSRKQPPNAPSIGPL